MNGNDIIEKLVGQYGEDDFLSWAKENGITPTYNAALYWLVYVKGITGEIQL